MTTDKRVDHYIAKAQPFAQPILRHFRKLVHKALPEVEEAIKWGVPHFVTGGRNAAGMASFKQHASIMLLSNETKGEGMGNFGKLTSVDDLPDDKVMIARIREAAEVAQGKAEPRVKPKPKPTIAMPADFAAALAATQGAHAVWDGFTDAQRRDYLEWITTAKQDATRAKRIATAAEWIGEGKRRNWKYEKC